MRSTLTALAALALCALACERQPADAPLARNAEQAARATVRTVETAGESLAQHTRAAVRQVQDNAEPARRDLHRAGDQIERGAHRLADPDHDHDRAPELERDR